MTLVSKHMHLTFHVTIITITLSEPIQFIHDTNYYTYILNSYGHEVIYAINSLWHEALAVNANLIR